MVNIPRSNNNMMISSFFYEINFTSCSERVTYLEDEMGITFSRKFQ